MLMMGAGIGFRRFSSRLNCWRQVGLVMALTYLAAPLVGWLNFRIMTLDSVPAALRPSRALRMLSWAGLVRRVTLPVSLRPAVTR